MSTQSATGVTWHSGLPTGCTVRSVGGNRLVYVLGSTAPEVICPCHACVVARLVVADAS